MNPTVGATNIHRRTEDNPYALAGLRATLGEKRPRRFPSSVAGQYINMRVPTRRIVAERWTATCVGNSAEIRRLLSHVSHFGKFAAHGLGRVLDWHVEPAESFSFHDADGQPLRPIPSENGEGAVQGWTPPYWRRETWRFCHSSAARRSIC